MNYDLGGNWMSWQKDLDAGEAEFIAGQFIKAERTFAGAVKELETEKKNSAEHARALQWLGRTRSWLAKYKQADKDLIAARHIEAEIYGEASKEVAVNNLFRSENCLYMENFDEAYSLASGALKLLEETVPKNDLSIAHALERLGVAAQYLNRLSEAEPYLTKAMGIRSAQLGEDHRLVAETLNRLSACHAANENFTLAGSLGRKALKIQEEKLGPHHPELGLTLYNLASQYVRTGMFERGGIVARRGLEVLKNSLPDHHPLVVRMSERLAAICLANCDYDESEELHKSALASAEKIWPADSLNLVSLLVGTGSSHLAKMEWNQAEKCFKRSLNILEKAPELNTGLEYTLLRQLQYSYLFQLKVGDALLLTPATYRAKHTSDATQTLDLLNKVVGFLGKKIELISKGEN